MKRRRRALDRLRRDAPEGPPFVGLLLDVPTVEALALGAVNARAEVAARRALAALDASQKSQRRDAND